MIRTRRQAGWQDIANTLLGVIWMLSGFLAAIISLVVGMALIGIPSGACVFFLGLGIVRQQWFALMAAKLTCFAMGIYAIYMLIAIAAVQGMPNRLSLPYALFMLVASIVQGYIFWSVSES